MLRRSASCTNDFLSAVGESTTHQSAVIKKKKKKRQLLANTILYAHELRQSGLNVCSQQQAMHVPKVVSTTEQAELST